MATAGATGAAEADARAGGRSHRGAEMVAAAGGAGSDGTPVKLCITNVYSSSSTEVMSLETTSTIGDLKKLLQEAFPNRPSPHQQRLIFRGKQCEEGQQLGHVLRGLDLSGQHNIHLIVSQSADQISANGNNDVRVSAAAAAAAAADQQSASQPQSRPRPRLRPQMPIGGTSRSSGEAAAATSAGAPSAGAEPGAAAAAASKGRPERIQLSQTQLGQLQWQYQQALRDNERALDDLRRKFDFLSAQSRALSQQQQHHRRHPSPRTFTFLGAEQQQQLPPHFPQPNEQEVSVRAATRALGGNMPGPVGGGGVRDVTGPPPAEHIPPAGLGEDGEAGRGNLVDPAPRAPDIAREARGWFKMVVQCILVTLVFGIDADGWILALLALGAFVAFLFRSGLLKEMLGSGREGGGLWAKLSTWATVVTEGGGLLMDVRYFFSAFFLSLFPKWQPVRSPEAIAAEAAAQALLQEGRAQAAAAARAGLRTQPEQAGQEAAAATGAPSPATPALGAPASADLAPDAMPAERGATPAVAGVADSTTAVAATAAAAVVAGTVDAADTAGEGSNTSPAPAEQRADDVDPASPD